MAVFVFLVHLMTLFNRVGYIAWNESMIMNNELR